MDLFTECKVIITATRFLGIIWLKNTTRAKLCQPSRPDAEKVGLFVSLSLPLFPDLMPNAAQSHHGKQSSITSNLEILF